MQAATALAIGTALQVGVTLAGKYLASQAARGPGCPVGRRPPGAVCAGNRTDRTRRGEWAGTSSGEVDQQD
jgi:hypothetical protein